MCNDERVVISQGRAALWKDACQVISASSWHSVRVGIKNSLPCSLNILLSLCVSLSLAPPSLSPAITGPVDQISNVHVSHSCVHLGWYSPLDDWRKWVGKCRCSWVTTVVHILLYSESHCFKRSVSFSPGLSHSPPLVIILEAGALILASCETRLVVWLGLKSLPTDEGQFNCSRLDISAGSTWCHYSTTHAN